MGLFDSLMGRRRPPAPKLDALFAVPTAALTLETAGWVPTGSGAVCFRSPEGVAADQTRDDVKALLDADGGVPVEWEGDSFGFTWLVVRYDPPDTAALVADLHAVNLTLAEQGFDASLLCSTISFEATGGRRLGLVYLYKQGTFYPFVPTGPQQRDNLTELAVRDLVAGDVPVEPQLSRWLALWGAPGL